MIIPHLIYDDVEAATTWLTQTFGFRERSQYRHFSEEGTLTRTQLEFGYDVITLGTPSIHAETPRKGVSSMLYVYVDDVDAHYARTLGSHPPIVIELSDRPWGDRVYQVTDPEGHQWTFAQCLPAEVA